VSGPGADAGVAASEGSPAAGSGGGGGGGGGEASDDVSLLAPAAGAAALQQVAFHFAVAVAYVVAHSLILFLQIVCLEVAING
jgi:hypothetical protein